MTDDKALELMNALGGIKDCYLIDEDDREIIDKAIEAIKLIQLIAQTGDTDHLGEYRDGEWCAEQARSWLESLK